MKVKYINERNKNNDLEEDFGKLAKKNSDDTGTFEKEGLIENFTKKDVVEEFFFYDVTIANPIEAAPSVDDVQFLSVFISGTKTPEADYKIIEVTAEGNLQEHTEPVSISGLSGYFLVAPTLPAYDYAVIVLDNSVSTSINEIKVNGEAIKVMMNQQVYILQGERIYGVTGQQK